MTGQRRKLLYVIHETDYFMMHWLHIALEVQKSGLEVHVAAPLRGDYESISQFGFTFHPITISRREGLPWQEIKSIGYLYKLISSIKPDIVHNIAIKTILYGGIAARLASFSPLVSSFTGLGFVFMSDSLKAKCIKLLISKGYKYIFNYDRCKIVFQNHDDLRFMTQAGIVPANKAILIGGAGVDTLKFNVIPEPLETPIVVLPARMLLDKGVTEFVEAARKLKSESCEARFVLVGDCDEGNPTSIPKSMLLEWHNSGIIEWWGQRNDMPVVYERSAIVCLPSYREGLPTVLCEAASSGRPLVATDVPGCREVVRDGINGLLVPARDSNALAEALRKLIDNKELRETMGAMGREIVINEFSEEKVVAETLALYQELLSR